MKPIRKFTVRAVVPGSLERARRARGQPPVVVARADEAPLPAHRSRAVAQLASATRSPSSARSIPRGWPSSRPTAGTSSGPSASARASATTSRSPAGSSRSAPRLRARSRTSHPSSASPRRCRSTRAGSASSRAITSRPPPTSACRSSASGCSTRPGTSRSRSRDDGWQQERYPVLDPDGLPLSVLRGPDGSAGAGDARAARRRQPARAGVEGVRRAHHAPACSTPTSRRTPTSCEP